MTLKRTIVAVLATGVMGAVAMAQNPFIAPANIDWVNGGAGAPGGASPSGALSFGGASGALGFVSLGDFNIPDETSYTMSFWLNAADVSNESFIIGTTNQGIHHGLRQPNDGTGTQSNGGGAQNALHSAHWGNDHRAGTRIDTNTWAHGVITYNAETDQGEIFLNGTSDALGGPFTQGDPNTDAPLIIGARNNGDRPFTGLLDDVAIWSGTVLSASEISAIASGASPNSASTAPTAYYTFDTNSGTTAFDTSIARNDLDGTFLGPPGSIAAGPASDVSNLSGGLAVRWWSQETINGVLGGNHDNQLARAQMVVDSAPNDASYFVSTIDEGAAGPDNSISGNPALGANFGNGANAFGYDGNFADAPTDNTLWAYDGFIEIRAEDDVDPTAPGIQVAFGIPSDDATNLVIGGVEVLNNDGGHGFPGGGAGPQSVDFNEGPGFYSVSAILTQGGGGVGFELLSSIGGGNEVHELVSGGGGVLTDAVPASRLFNAVPEPSSCMLLLMSITMVGGMFRRKR